MQRQVRFYAASFAVPVLLCMGASMASATAIIQGQLNITGSVTVSNKSIDWAPPAGGNGIFDVVVPGTGYFAGLATTPSTYTGDEVDLVSPTPVPPFPPGFFVDNFLANLRFIIGGAPAPAPYNNLHFDLTSIPIPSSPACLGNGTDTVCTQGVFQLTDLGGGQTLIGLRVQGFFEDTNLDCHVTPTPIGCTAAAGRYSTQVGQSIATIKSTIDGGGFISASYSGNFDSGVPEPGTLESMFLGGLLLSVALYTRKLTQKS